MHQLLGIVLIFALVQPVISRANPAGLGSAAAKKGGAFTILTPSYPKDLLFYLAFDELSFAINNQILEPLAENHPVSFEFMPRLAEKWIISKDKMKFTFSLNKKAAFSDGKPVTAHDVKFTFDTIMDPKNKTVPWQSNYSSIASCHVVDDHTVQFQAKTVHFKNFEKLAGLLVLPKHFFEKGDFNRDFSRKILGSGAYTLKELKHGEKVTLERSENFWGKDLTQNIGRYNFDKLVYRAVSDYNVGFEMFKKGDGDFFYFLMAKMWETETDSIAFKNGYIKKLRADTLSPYATSGIAWNLRKTLFQDSRVRLALSHLFNRERIIKDLFYHNYLAATGTVHTKSIYHSSKLKPIPFDPNKAKVLLREAGWTKTDDQGILIKDAERFEFTLLINSAPLERPFTVYQEDLKRSGIKMNIVVKDWASSLKLVDDRNFDATGFARGRSTHPSDYADMWGSNQADLKGSSNMMGYKNPKLDALAMKIDATFDQKARIPLVKEIDEIIASDQPASFGWEAYFLRIGYWNRFGHPKQIYFPYSEWHNIFEYWWLDDIKSQKLQAARQSGVALKD